jgi:hypothetical protein
MVVLVFGVMIGIVLGLRFNVFVLFPAFGLVLLSTAAVGIGRGERLGSVVLTVVFVGSALQIGYQVGFLARAVWPHTACAMRMGRGCLLNGRIEFAGFHDRHSSVLQRMVNLRSVPCIIQTKKCLTACMRSYGNTVNTLLGLRAMVIL